MSLGNMEERTEGIKKQAQELIEQAYQSGYTEGYSKAENDYHVKTEDDRQSSYELGLNMAWEAARKLSDARNANEILDDGAIFYCVNIFERHTASEAIEKLYAYEEQKKQKQDSEIKVGDEVVLASDKSKGIVIQTNTNIINIFVFFPELGETRWLRDVCLVKTGRHFDIESILRKMGGDEE